MKGLFNGNTLGTDSGLKVSLHFLIKDFSQLYFVWRHYPKISI